MKKIIHKYFNVIHRSLLGSDAGVNTITFAKNISISLFGGLGAFFTLFVASIIAARVLGPEEYGKYSVFLSVAQFLSLLFVLELDVSALYFLAKKTKKKKQFTTAIGLMFLINIIIFSLLAIGVYQGIGFKSVTGAIFFGMIVMGFSFALKRMIDAFLRSDGNFKTQASLRLLESFVVVCALLLLFFVFDRTVYISYVQSIIIGGLVFSVGGMFFLRGFFHLSFDRDISKRINEVFHYNIYGLINALVNGSVKNGDKILVATFLGLNTAGVYAVYFMATVVIGARITQIVMNVFFPSVRSDTSRIAPISQKINILFVKLFVPLVICASVGVWMIVVFYGDGFERSLLWSVLGGVYIAVHFFASLYGWLLSSVSRAGYKLYNTSFLYGIVGYGAILFVIMILGHLSITAFLCALIVYRAISGVFCFWTLRDQMRAL